MRENKRTPEQQEIKPNIDFRHIFDAKLKSIEPLSNEESEWESRGMESVGIHSVNRKAPSIVFYTNRQLEAGFDIWVEDDKDCNHRYPHDDVNDKFIKFQEEKGVNIAISGISSYVIEDKEGKRYLLFMDNVADYRKNDLNDAESAKRWDDLAQRYNIEKMLGSFQHITREVSENPETGWISISESYGQKFENILDKDTLTRIRENSYLRDFAEKYAMTNSQFMRFRLRAISAREAAITDKEAAGRGIKYLIDLDDLAKEVIAQDDEEGHL